MNADILGKITGFVSAAERKPKVARFALQSVAYSLLPNSRIRVCQRVRTPGKETVDIYHREKTNSARYSGLMSCALAWVCPLCALRLSEIRRDELSRAFDHARGVYEPFLATYTIRHKRGDKLVDLIAGINAAYRTMRQNRAWRNFKEEHAVVGEIRALEITYSPESGWHPHFHVIVMISTSTVGERDTDNAGQPVKPTSYTVTKADRVYWSGILQERLWEHWIAALEKHGLTAEKTHGMHVQPGEFVTYYVSKYGSWDLSREMVSHYQKQVKSASGETVWDMLIRHWAGDESAAALFLEYHAATKGKSQLQWSPGLRDLLRSPDRSSDPAWWDELGEDEVLLMSLTPQDWDQVIRYGAEGEVLHRAAEGDPERVRALLADLYSRSSI